MADEFVDYIQVFEGGDGKWYFHAKSNNGEVVATSEGYERRWETMRAAMQAFPEKSIEVKGDDPEAA